MATEQKWMSVPAQLLTSNGTADGTISVPDTALFKVKQKVKLVSDTLQSRDLEVKRILSKNLIKVGPQTAPIFKYSDVSDLLVSDNASISADEQNRPAIIPDAYNRAVYEEEPVMAKRVVQVDKYGNKYDTENPMPVQLSDGSINIGTVNGELEVQLSHKDNFPDSGDIADSVRIGNGTNELSVNSDGSINVRDITKLIKVPHDDVVYTRDANTQVITKIEYKFETNIVCTLMIVRDAYLNITRVYKA